MSIQYEYRSGKCLENTIDKMYQVQLEKYPERLEQLLKTLKICIDGEELTEKMAFIISRKENRKIIKVEFPINNKKVSKIDIYGHNDNLLILSAYKPQDCSEEAQELRNLMFGGYENFSQKLMKLVHNPESTLQQRLQGIKVLNFLNPKEMQNDFEPVTFIKLNILLMEDPDEAIIFEFLGHFTYDSSVIAEILNTLFDTEVTPRGFQTLMALVKSESCLLEYIKTLTKLIQSAMSKNSYQILRQNGIQGPLFDELIFFNTQQHKVNPFLKENNLMYQTEDSKVIQTLIKTYSIHQGYQYDIQLDGKYTINNLKLIFQENLKQQCKMRIQIFNEDQLIYDRFQSEWMYYYLALKNDLNMKIPVDITASKIVIKVQFSYSNTTQTVQEKSQMPTTPLFMIPELEGYNKSEDIALENINSKESFQIGNSSQYQQQLVEQDGNSYYLLKCNNKIIEKDYQRRVKMLKIHLSNFQDTLREKIVIKENLDDIISIIIGIQSQLAQFEKMKPTQYSNSLDFLYNYWIRLSEILINDPPQGIVPQLKLGQLIFQQLVIEDIGDIQDQALKFLKNVVFKSFSERNWMQFLFAQYEKISQPFYLINLKKLEIPLTETLIYLNLQFQKQFDYQKLLAIMELLEYAYQSVEKKKDQKKVLRPPGVKRSMSSQDNEQIDKIIQQSQEMSQDMYFQMGFQFCNWIVDNNEVMNNQHFLMLLKKSTSVLCLIIKNSSEVTIEQSNLIQFIYKIFKVGQNQTYADLTQILENLFVQNKYQIMYIMQLILQTIINFVKHPDYKCHYNSANTFQWFSHVKYISQLIIKFKKSIDADITPLPPHLQKKQDIWEIEQFSKFQQTIQDQHYCGICSTHTLEFLVHLLSPGTQLNNITNQFELYLSVNYWHMVLQVIEKVRIVPQNLQIFQLFFQYYFNAERNIQVALHTDVFSLLRKFLEKPFASEISSQLLKIFLEHENIQFVYPFLTLITKFSEQDHKYLLDILPSILLNKLNLGSGYHLNEKILPKLQLCQYVLKAISSYEIKPQLFNLLMWYTLNKEVTLSLGKSPAIDILNENVQLVGDILRKQEALAELFNFYNDFDELFWAIESELPQFLGLTLLKNLQTVIDEFLSQWLQSDDQIKQIFCDNGRLNLLLKRLIIQDEQQFDYNKMKLEEFGQKIELQISGQQSYVNLTDWQANKKGVKTRLITLPFDESNELSFILKFPAEVEVRFIRIGFQGFTTDFSDQVLGTPSDGYVDAGLEQDNLIPLGQLQLINDEGYGYYAVKVMALNLQKINGNNLRNSLRSLTCCKKIRYLRIRLQKPLIAFLEGVSQMHSKQYNRINIGINFISILGYKNDDLPNHDQLVNFQQKINMGIIGKICNQKFKKTLQSIAHNPLVKDKFMILNKLLSKNEKDVWPLLIGVARYNEDFGNYMLTECMNQEGDLVHAKLCSELLFMDESRLQTMQNYLLDSDVKNLNQFCLLIEGFLIGLHLQGKKMMIENLEQKELIVKDQQIERLFNLIQENNCNSQVLQMEKLLINLIFPPIAFKEQINYKMNIVEKCWQNRNMRLLGGLILGDQELVNWFDEQKINMIMEELIKLIDEAGDIKEYLQFVNNIIEIEQIRKIITKNKWDQKVFMDLKDQNTQLKPIEINVLPMLVEFIGKMTIYEKSEERIAKKLIQDIEMLEQVQDINYIENILIPLLNYEHQIEFTLDIWNSIDQQYISDIKKLISQQDQNIKKDKCLFQSKLLKANQEEKLNKMIENDIPFNAQWNLVCEIDQESGCQHVDQIKNNILTNPPYIILMDGINYQTGQQAVIGVYCSSKIKDKPTNESDQERWDIPQKNENLLFCYEDEHAYHFKSTENIFGKFFNEDSEIYLVYQYDLNFQISIVFAENILVKAEFSLQDMNPQELNYNQDYIISDYALDKIYFYQLQSIQPKKSYLDLIDENILQQTMSSPLLKQISNNNILSYYSSTPIYKLPINIDNINQCITIQISNQDMILKSDLLQLDLNFSKIQEETFQSLTTTHGLISLQVDGVQLISLLQPGQPQCKYTPQLNIYSSFADLNGVEKIIQLVSKNIDDPLWKQYIQEVYAFSSIPQFFSFYIKNKQSMSLLFSLLSGKGKNQNEAVRFIYNTLLEVFKKNNNKQIREIAIQKNLIHKLLERISIISKEQKRQWNDQIIEEEAIQLNKQQSEEIKKPAKKQGTGYGSDYTGQNQKWNTQEYIEKKQEQGQQLLILLEILQYFFDQWQLDQNVSQQVIHILFQSSLLPLLESAFRSGSLLEMNKEHQLYVSYLNLVKVFASNQYLIQLLLPIPKNYLPRQSESIYQLINKLKDIATIFKDAAKQESVIADTIIETQKLIQQEIEHEHDDNDDQIPQTLPEQYKYYLQHLRFDYTSMKEQNSKNYQHFYSSYITSQPSSAKLIRLAQEFADMSNSLPIEHTNSIFMRADKERVDCLKAMVMGAKGTPYAHGAFIFDIYCDENYPNSPPKMNLTTTGQGEVRFNPNLYACGKVCLSLLGTWRGQASENWDPKISTLLQVLVSTQAIIMSEDVYFNEPGFEGEAGSVEGEAKNEAYCNIVRLCNIKYAMIDQLKNPAKGFEEIIRRHFYIKKEEILEEVKKWIVYAEKRTAHYSGLVYDHNSNWCSLFSKDKNKYKNMLTEAIQELEQLLNQLQPPQRKQKSGKKKLIKLNSQVEQNVMTQQLNIDEIDVTYDKDLSQQEFNINSEEVQDRWSRYIGAVGIDAVKKQASAKVLISGLGPLGIEIAKNIVLAGVQKLVIYDTKLTTESDLSGQFFLGKDDLNKPRAKQSYKKLQQLNSYVKVELTENKELQEKFDLVIITETDSNDDIIYWSKSCRENKIKLIVSTVNGLFARIMNDFGEEFIVIDKDGEEMQDQQIKSIENNVVTIHNIHKYQDGDIVEINKTKYKIQIINKSQFSIKDNTQPIEIGDGKVKYVKVPTNIQFKAIHEIINSQQDVPFDDLLLSSDFTKLEHPLFSHLAYSQQKINDESKLEAFNKFEQIFGQSSCGTFPPLAAFIGGFVAQEAIKALTNKYMPIRQLYYTDCLELYDPQNLIGDQLITQLKQTKLFMVGCGAIGCELLKNFAMLNIGIEGKLVITDPDHIENSNLNRQFLFREKHIKKSKSQTAAACIVQMNPLLKNSIIARSDKVHEQTEHIFTDSFFQDLDLVANALDNVQARRYVDKRCVSNQRPLLESGTLGSKGHVQCIVPFLTETYGDQNDPVEDGDIPYCTLKMFPEETLHCIEFARDKFSKLFNLKPKNAMKLKDQKQFDDLNILKDSVKLLKNLPKTYEDCILWAKKKFNKYFNNDIKQLIYTYPLDQKTKDGNLFWTLPKRPPKEIEFDEKDELHLIFISTLTYLRAKMYGLETPKNWRDKGERQKIGEIAKKIKLEEWEPSDQKKQEISNQVMKQEQPKEQQEEQVEEIELDAEKDRLIPQLQENKMIQLFAEEFEKDNDHNGHIDFIYGFGNLRAQNYQLDRMDWITVKLKAGRIVPAMATTTAVIAGLQTIELCKVIKKCKLEEMKNGFINLAVPYVQLTEPGEVVKIKLNEQVTVTVWDRWEIKNGKQLSLKRIFEQLEELYKLKPINAFYKGSPVYMNQIMNTKDKEQEKKELLDSKLVDLIDLTNQQYCDLIINFSQVNDELSELVKNVPPIRVHLN